MTEREEISSLPRASGVPEAEAVAWVYQLACARDPDTGEYGDWGPAQISLIPPRVPEGAARILRTLYAAPPPVAAPSGEAEKLGAWLSAALEDPIVCDEMKAYIENWFNAGMPSYSNGETLDWADLGVKLKQKMENERFSVRALAEKLKLSHSTISRVCNGKPCTVEAYLTITAWLAPPSPIASEPKDAGSGEGHELTEGEQATVLADLRDTSMIWALADIRELHKAGYRITRTSPSGAKP